MCRAVAAEPVVAAPKAVSPTLLNGQVLHSITPERLALVSSLGSFVEQEVRARGTAWPTAHTPCAAAAAAGGGGGAAGSAAQTARAADGAQAAGLACPPAVSRTRAALRPQKGLAAQQVGGCVPARSSRLSARTARPRPRPTGAAAAEAGG